MRMLIWSIIGLIIIVNLVFFALCVAAGRSEKLAGYK